jgi:hypothetical protein
VIGAEPFVLPEIKYSGQISCQEVCISFFDEELAEFLLVTLDLVNFGLTADEMTFSINRMQVDDQTVRGPSGIVARNITEKFLQFVMAFDSNLRNVNHLDILFQPLFLSFDSAFVEGFVAYFSEVGKLIQNSASRFLRGNGHVSMHEFVIHPLSISLNTARVRLSSSQSIPEKYGTIGIPSLSCRDLFVTENCLRFLVENHLRHLVKLAKSVLIWGRFDDHDSLVLSRVQSSSLAAEFYNLSELTPGKMRPRPGLRRRNVFPDFSSQIRTILEYRDARIAVSGTGDLQMGEQRSQKIRRRRKLVHNGSVGHLSNDQVAIEHFVRTAAAGDRVEFMEYYGEGRMIVCVTNVAVLLFEGRNPVERFPIDHVQDVQRSGRSLQFVVGTKKLFKKQVAFAIELANEDLAEQLELVFHSLCCMLRTELVGIKR